MTTSCGQTKKLIFDDPPSLETRCADVTSPRPPTPPSPLPFELQEEVNLNFYKVLDEEDTDPRRKEVSRRDAEWDGTLALLESLFPSFPHLSGSFPHPCLDASSTSTKRRRRFRNGSIPSPKTSTSISVKISSNRPKRKTLSKTLSQGYQTRPQSWFNHLVSPGKFSFPSRLF